MNIKKTVLLAIPLLLAACTITPVTKLTHSGDAKFEPLEPSCELTIYTTQPKKNFVEVGMVDAQKCHFWHGCPTNATDAVEMFRKDVCSAGGNAVLLWEVNGYGRYLKATAIRTL